MGLNILKSLRAQFSQLFMRWLSPVYLASWIGLTFCGVLFVALWRLFRVTNLQDVQGMQEEEMDDAIHMAMDLELEFKDQMQSWKNLLLRGDDPQMFQRYSSEFERTESSVQSGLFLN